MSIRSEDLDLARQQLAIRERYERTSPHADDSLEPVDIASIDLGRARTADAGFGAQRR